jgi:hypothetical protein
MMMTAISHEADDVVDVCDVTVPAGQLKPVVQIVGSVAFAPQ